MPVGECPYPGLASFGREQARWFFGRDQLTSKLIARLDNRLRSGGMQMVVAPSGAGKSSLLHAGLLPKLDNGALPGSSQWPRIVFTPTADPLAALASHIAALIDADSAALAEKLAAPSPSARAVLRQLLLNRLGREGSGARLVVVVDQFEELFTLCTDDQQRRTFSDVLFELTRPPLSVEADGQILGLVVVGVRADFYAACANDTHLRTALEDNPLLVGPMSDTELREAILYPAQDVGLDVEPGLVDLLLRDLGDTAPITGECAVTSYEAGRLPLLAHALRATWQQRHGHTLTVEGYRNTGGIHHAVATTAENVFTGLDPTSQHVARTLFLRLVKVGDGTEDTRRRLARRDLLSGLNAGSVGPVVDAFTTGRLLTQDQDTVEITHEALLRAWPRLRQWIDTDRVGNLIRQELDDAATVWDRQGRDTAGLYRGSRLEAARTWAASRLHEDDLSPAASAFLAASTQQEHRAARLRRTVLVVLSVLALVASGAAVVALHLSSTAQRERDTAIFNQLTARADRLRSTDVSLAAQLDLTAYRMQPTQDLYTALVTLGNAALSTTPLTGHTDHVRSVVFSPDGRTLASGSADQTVRLWNVANPAHPTPLGTPLAESTPWGNLVVFTPDGRTLATGDANTVRLWNVTDPVHPTPLGLPLTGHTDDINAVVFSLDGHLLATGSGDQTVRLWNVTDPAHPTPLGPPLTGHTNVVRSVAFSPNGHTLVSGSDDRTTRLWDIPQTFLSHTAHVTAVAFSPHGRTLVTGSDDRTVRLWNVTDPARPAPLGPPLTGHTNWVHAVVFSPDGRILGTGDGETVRLWNVTDPAHPTPLGPPLTGHTDDITAMVFSPDGHTLASGSNDHTVRLWNVTDPAHPTALGPPMTGHTGWVKSVVFSPDGRTLASGSADQTIRLWNVTDPAHPIPLGQPLTGHGSLVNSVAFSPNGRTLASGSDDHTVRLWNVTDLTHPLPLGPVLTGHTSYVNAVVFSPDGHILASGSYDGTVRLWNVTDPAHPTSLGQPLTGHTYSVVRVAFSPDGHTLVTGSEDDTIRLWEMNVDQVIRRICAITTNTLTPVKWDQYVSPDLPYRPPCP
ncbi:MAG: hypothetical protein JO115_13605 [Pseudonocardiales bacterium]|nr:hypothetical protein [Pseudonocardiales bacterium]